MTILTVYFHVESRATDDSSSSSSPCLRSVFHHFPLSVVMFFLYVRSASTEDKVRYPTAKKKSAYIFMKNMQRNSSGMEGSQYSRVICHTGF